MKEREVPLKMKLIYFVSASRHSAGHVSDHLLQSDFQHINKVRVVQCDRGGKLHLVRGEAVQFPTTKVQPDFHHPEWTGGRPDTLHNIQLLCLLLQQCREGRQK